MAYTVSKTVLGQSGVMLNHCQDSFLNEKKTNQDIQIIPSGTEIKKSGSKKNMRGTREGQLSLLVFLSCNTGKS